MSRAEDTLSTKLGAAYGGALVVPIELHADILPLGEPNGDFTFPTMHKDYMPVIGEPCHHGHEEHTCTICKGKYCRGCFRLNKGRCNRCYSCSEYYRKEGHLPTVLAFSFLLKDQMIAHNIKRDVFSETIRACATILRKKSAGPAPGSEFFYTKFENWLCQTPRPVQASAVIGCKFDSSMQSAYRTAGPEDLRVMFQRVDANKWNDFRGWCVCLRERRSPEWPAAFYYIENHRSRSCDSCDGTTRCDLKANFSDSFDSLLAFCLDERQLNLIYQNRNEFF